MSQERPRIALYSGLIVERDAISYSLRRKLDAIRSPDGQRLGLEPVAFCQYSDVEDPAIRVVGSNVLDLVGHPDFKKAVVHVFEFGISYDLFNVAMLLPQEQMAAIYHNITPRELVVDPVVQMAIDRSMAQKHLFDRMSVVGCDSEYNKKDLIDFGIEAGRLSVIPLPASIPVGAGPLRGRMSAKRPIRFLFVGRFVRAKGVNDLLHAARRLVERGHSDLEVRLVGRMDASDSATREHVEAALRDPVLGPCLTHSPDLSIDELHRAYLDADALIIPSYHEGYCVPVLEAFAAGCQVIVYDNSNLPAVTGGLGTLVPTGDVEQLTMEMERLTERLRIARSSGEPYKVATTSGNLTEEDWQMKVDSLAADIPATHDKGFLELVSAVLGSATEVPARI